MKKRITAFALTLVLIIGTFSTGVMAATQTEVDTEVKATAGYLASQLDGNVELSTYLSVFLIATSGIECSSIKEQFLDAVNDNITTYTKLSDSYGNETPEVYGSIIMTLKACGFDPTNIGGRNLITDFGTFLSTYDFSYYYGSMYELDYIMSSLQYYSNDISGSSTYIENVKAKILSYYCETEYTGDVWVNDPDLGWIQEYTTVTGTGFYYYGFNPDNNAKMISILKPFYDTDSEVKSIVDTIIPLIESSLDSNYQSAGSYGVNSDTTGLALSGLSVFNKSISANVYSGLLGFKHSSISGAYFIDSSATAANNLATRDALEGLLSYSRMIQGRPSIYDLSAPIIKNTTTYNLSILNPTAIPSDSILSINPLTTIPTAISTSLDKIGKNYILFDFSLSLNGATIQPGTPLQFSLDVPAGYTNPKIYYIDSNGVTQLVDSKIVDGKIVFTLSHFSNYAIVDAAVSPRTFDSLNIVFLSFALVLSGSAMIYLFRRKVSTR